MISELLQRKTGNQQILGLGDTWTLLDSSPQLSHKYLNNQLRLKRLSTELLEITQQLQNIHLSVQSNTSNRSEVVVMETSNRSVGVVYCTCDGVRVGGVLLHVHDPAVERRFQLL